MNVLSKLSVKIIIGIVTVALACVSGTAPELQKTAFEEKAFIASDQQFVQTYTMDETGKLREAKAIPRGTKVTFKEDETMELGGETVQRIYLDNADEQTTEPADAGSAQAETEPASKEQTETEPADAETDAAATNTIELTNAAAASTRPDGVGPGRAAAAAEQAAAGAASEAARAGLIYVKPEHLTKDWDQVVQEKERYVRTPVTIYRNGKGPEIAGFAAKGTKLEVTGFAGLDAKGAVTRYKVRPAAGKDAADDIEGFVYSKYLVRTQEEADVNYNEHGEYDKAKKAKFGINLHGGKATGLDYFPYERTNIKGKAFCREARGMYLNWYAAMHGKQYIKLIKETNCNAVVIDIKDGQLSYKSPVAKELAPKAYKKAHVSAEDYKAAVKQFQDAGVYTIGRITCFNDKYYAKDHPENCIRSSASSSGWPSAYSRDVWYYNVALAIEAVEMMGFDEIQFDYVRFPESSYEMSLDKKTNFRNKYNESKAQAVQNFCFYAADQIHEAGAYFSVDVFGECSDGYVTAYGQYWPAISNVVDAISSMPYTDHFGDADTWSNPKPIMRHWAKSAAKEQTKIPTPAAARTWITGYNTPYWAPQVTYGRKKLKQQVDALYDAGLDGGFIPWNSASSIDAYRSYKGIWDYDK